MFWLVLTAPFLLMVLPFFLGVGIQIVAGQGFIILIGILAKTVHSLVTKQHKAIRI